MNPQDNSNTLQIPTPEELLNSFKNGQCLSIKVDNAIGNDTTYLTELYVLLCHLPKNDIILVCRNIKSCPNSKMRATFLEAARFNLRESRSPSKEPWAYLGIVFFGVLLIILESGSAKSTEKIWTGILWAFLMILGVAQILRPRIFSVIIKSLK